MVKVTINKNDLSSQEYEINISLLEEMLQGILREKGNYQTLLEGVEYIFEYKR